MQSINMRCVKFINISLDRIANCWLSLLMKVEMLIHLSVVFFVYYHLLVFSCIFFYDSLINTCAELVFFLDLAELVASCAELHLKRKKFKL